MLFRFVCDICKKKKEFQANSALGQGTGFAIIGEQKICYRCIGDLDKLRMDKMVAATFSKNRRRRFLYFWLYLGQNSEIGYHITNICGSLKYKILKYKRNKNNPDDSRRDIWFKDHKGIIWYGVHYGDDNARVKCRPLKRQVIPI